MMAHHSLLLWAQLKCSTMTNGLLCVMTALMIIQRVSITVALEICQRYICCFFSKINIINIKIRFQIVYNGIVLVIICEEFCLYRSILMYF